MKHAYLIMAHNEFDILRLLVSTLDDPRNDIYIHLDKKVSLSYQDLRLRVKYSQLFFMEDRVDAGWGSFSQIQTEYKLWHTAYKPDLYSYYHLLSGVDLPLKSQDYIHNFFDKHQGTEFIHFRETFEHEIRNKVRSYHFLVSHPWQRNTLMKKLKSYLNLGLYTLPRVLGIWRNKNVSFQIGYNWASITSACVKVLLDNETEVNRIFKYSFCADEIYKQTMINGTPLRKNVYHPKDGSPGDLRLVLWNGNYSPVEYTPEHEELLKSSPLLFARKFTSKDMDFLRRIVTYEEGQ